MKKATDEYRSFNREVNFREQYSREQVLNELKDLWKFKLNEEKHLISKKFYYWFGFIREIEFR